MLYEKLTSFLQLPENVRRNRSVYERFYTPSPAIEVAIDLHREFPISTLKKEPIDG